MISNIYAGVAQDTVNLSAICTGETVILSAICTGETVKISDISTGETQETVNLFLVVPVNKTRDPFFSLSLFSNNMNTIMSSLITYKIIIYLGTPL